MLASMLFIADLTSMCGFCSFIGRMWDCIYVGGNSRTCGTTVACRPPRGVRKKGYIESSICTVLCVLTPARPPTWYIPIPISIYNLDVTVAHGFRFTYFYLQQCIYIILWALFFFLSTVLIPRYLGALP